MWILRVLHVDYRFLTIVQLTKDIERKEGTL